MQSLDVASPLPVTTVFDVYCLYKQQAERRAKVALLTQDTMEYLTPWLEAMRDAFNRMPGVTIVADIAPNPGSKENPDVDVVLGATGWCSGSGGSPRCWERRPDQFLGGIDGEPDAVSEIKKRGVPTRRASPCHLPCSAMQ